MATSVKTFADASKDGAADQTITELSGLPSIPSNAVLNSVVLSFTCDRTDGRDDNEIRVQLGDTIHFYIQDLGRNDSRTCNITSIVNNNGGNLSYINGTTTLKLYAYHEFRLFNNANWDLTNIKITADYTERYTLTVQSANTSYGTVSGGGTYNNQATATLKATAKTGYKFKQWSDGNTSATRTVTVTGNVTYTAYFEPIYVIYDSIFSFKRWANNNLTSWDLITISNVTDTGFTGTAKVDDAYTTECRPLIPVEAGKTYTFECTASGGGFEFFVFNCESSGAWSDFTYGNTQSFNFTPTKSYISIRCDVVGAGTVVNFSNFRIYPADCPYMSNSVSATDRTDVASWSMPTPTREGYTFKGWNTKPDGSGTTYTSSSAYPSSDLVLYSQWAIKTYNVTFKDENGATLKTETVNHGSTVTAPADPTKADTAQWDYTFEGWYDANGNKWYPNRAITSDTIYTARYTTEVQKYTVKWYNEDGSVLLETDESVPYDTMPTYNGATPTKAETAENTYEHIGWSIDITSSGTTDLSAVVESVSYYARFRAISKGYTVAWKNEDGTVLETDTLVPYGTQPDYNGATPEKASDVQYDYTFLGWSANVNDPPLDDTQLETVKGDITYTAVYTKTLKLYPIKVILFDDEYTSVVEYGSDIVLEAPAVIGYKFTKWTDGNTDNPRTVRVTGEATYQAVYERIPVPIMVNNEQVTGVYIVPSTQTIVYVISGEVPTVETKRDTVDDWNFEVSNSVPGNSYPLEKLYINETRIW